MPYLELLVRQNWLGGSEAELDGLIGSCQAICRIKNPEWLPVDVSAVKSILLKACVHNYYQNAIAIKLELDELGIYEGFNPQFFMAIHWYTKFIINMAEEASLTYDQIRALSIWIMFHKSSFDHIAVNLPGEIDLVPDVMYAAIKKTGRWVL